MARILIADLAQGASRLSRILVDRDLDFADTVEAVLQKATAQRPDLLIIGVLFDFSRMCDMLKVAKDTPALADVPIMAFSDEHTAITTSNRDLLESVSHVLGACDYVDTRDMCDAEILERIEDCLRERRPVSRKFCALEASPAARRARQTVKRWNDTLATGQRKQAIRVLFVGAEHCEQLGRSLASVPGIDFDLTCAADFKSALVELSTGVFDAIFLDGTGKNTADEDLAQLKAFAPRVPMLLFGGECYDDNQQSIGLLPQDYDDGLTIALAVLTAMQSTVVDGGIASVDVQLASFLLELLSEGLLGLRENLGLDGVLADFCRQVQVYCQSRFASDLKLSVMLYDRVGNTLKMAAGPSLPESYNAAIAVVPVGADVGSCGTSAFLREPIYVTDIEADTRWDNYRKIALQHGLRACWSVPLYDRREIVDCERAVLGTLAMYYPAPREPLKSELQLIGAVSAVAEALLLSAR